VRYLILSDIHSNWEALEAVLADAANRYDEIVCCGDIVGYGADPNASIVWVRDHAATIVRGNHDRAATGTDDIEWFNPAARAATLWTQSKLTAANLSYLKNLPRGPLAGDGFQVAHGSPLDEDDYIVTPGQAAQLYGYLASSVTFFGHSHLQGGFLLRRSGTQPVGQVPASREEMEIRIPDDSTALVNPGSVGQPRDGDPRAAYALYSPEEKLIRYRRVHYDLETAQGKIINSGLPDVLAYRLSLGS